MHRCLPEGGCPPLCTWLLSTGSLATLKTILRKRTVNLEKVRARGAQVSQREAVPPVYPATLQWLTGHTQDTSEVKNS